MSVVMLHTVCYGVVIIFNVQLSTYDHTQSSSQYPLHMVGAVSQLYVSDDAILQIPWQFNYLQSREFNSGLTVVRRVVHSTAVELH